MADGRVVDMLDQSSLAPLPKGVENSILRNVSSGVVGFQPIEGGPLSDKVWDGRKTFLLAATALVRNDCVLATVKLKEGHVRPAGMAWKFHGLGPTRSRVDVKGAGNRCECCDAAR
ncbi:hypothetical protein E5D57_001072 [Metarhizium anisopliae]|nr:hypothetical protein E5D57_001072 [Metarhizium anisopliae]